jgi:hypothetical protein
VIVNRYHHDVIGDADPGDVVASLRGRMPAGLARRVADNFADYHVLARRDQRNVARLVAELGDSETAERGPILVPQLDDAVHDIDGLERVRRYLFASDEERAGLIAELVA